jgi:hypothetical protein
MNIKYISVKYIEIICITELAEILTEGAGTYREAYGYVYRLNQGRRVHGCASL